MSRQLKRWESPRQEGRNHKGRGGSARQRQHRKQMQHLRQKLKNNQNHGEGSHDASLSLLWVHHLGCDSTRSQASLVSR
ncbi:hypothetical protein [Trichothermofontia sp.]